ncbi:MAG: TIGR00730 family Rossman fold protein [Planctomycetota bacterium]
MPAVAVYCSSSDHIDPAHFAHARQLGQALAHRQHTLVWGGGRVGLMGEIARAVHDHHGTVVGVIPTFMQTIELCYDTADELIVTDTMRQRKQIMDERADAFIVLPGGFGTLEELSEILVDKILGNHDRPILLLNPDGFYDPLLALFDHFIQHQFAKPKHLTHLHTATTVPDLLNLLDEQLPTTNPNP